MLSFKRKNFIYILLTFILIINIFYIGQNGNNSYAASAGKITDGVTNVNFRVAPNGNAVTDENGKGIKLNGGHELTVLDTTNSAWYKVSLVYNGNSYTGYVSSQFVTLTDGNSNTSSDGGTSQGGGAAAPAANVVLSDSDFESQLSAEGFPESYKVLLRDIHAIHPNWQFKAVQTGIDWNTLISNEVNKQGQVKNLIYGASSAPHYNWRSIGVGYNPATNTWSPFDGKIWFAASDDLVRYYIDPRTYLYENFVFVFESLSYQEGVQNKQGVEAILNGSFMYNATPPGESRQYSDIIMEAAAQSGVSPYHIASRIKLEMGNTGGVAAKGTSSSYPGIFNYYNIGAFDTANGSPVEKGLYWASQSGTYGRPWNSASKSIIGGAQYLGASYIQRGQDTLYTQKFNVTYTGNLFNHQYMSNIQSPTTESQTNYKAYKANNLLESTMVFKIPVYSNMPATACVKPADSGNPNNWLKTLSISGYSITPTFAVNNVTDYSLIVGSSVSSINVSGSPVVSTSSVSGTGTINLIEGTNYIKINVIAQTGTARTYTLTVVRGNAAAGSQTIGTDMSASSSSVSSGGTASGSKGDINGDGKISTVDVVKLRRVIVGLDELTNDVLTKGDINGDGKISTVDVVKLRRHIVGLELIQ